MLFSHEESLKFSKYSKENSLRLRKIIGKKSKRGHLKGQINNSNQSFMNKYNIDYKDPYPGDSTLIKNLESFKYIPDTDTLEKLKYYYGAYNQIKGFRKHMVFTNKKEELDTNMWDPVSRWILYQKGGVLKKISDPVYVDIKDAQEEEVEKPKKKRNMRLRSKISKLYYIQKRKMQLGRNKASKMFSSMERGNHMSSLNVPSSSLGHPAIFPPRRRNESLLTPVRASNNKLNRDLCFSSAVNMLNKNDDSFTRSSTGSSNATNFKNHLTVTRDKFQGNSPTRSTGVGSSKNIDITDFNSTDPVARACLKSVASRRKKSKKVRKSTYDQMDLLYTSHGLRSPPSKSSMKPTKLESFTKKYPGKEGSFFLPGLEEEVLWSRDSFFETTEKKNKPGNNIKLRLKLRAEKDESLRKLSSTSNVSPREILSIPDID